jgi:hypothetical protein
MNAAAMQGMIQFLRPPPTSMLLQVLERLQRATAGSKLASYQQTGRRSGAQCIYHTLSWSGDAAMALLHSWRVLPWLPASGPTWWRRESSSI